MNDTKIIIDAGHGGSDPGAVSGNNQEKTYNLQIAQYLYNRFQELGVPVFITRDSDVTLEPNARVQKIMNAFGADPNVILLSNHLNSGGGVGAEIVYPLRNSNALADAVLTEIGNAGQITRRVYQRRLPSDTSKDYYYILRETTPLQALLIEYGFIDNAADLTRIRNNYQAYAEAVVRAVTNYAGLPYAPPGGSLPSTGTYTVQSGDTLYTIARRFNTTVDAIKNLNNLTSNNLTIGQTLTIPTSTIPPTTDNYILYTVVSGDNLYSIARRYNTTASEIMSFNNLANNVLQIGQVLRIPTTEISEPEEPSIPGDNYITYTVQRGDSLHSIANKYDTTVAALVAANNLQSNTLQIGQVLRIPVTDELLPEEPSVPDLNYIEYTVQRGDSLYSIANRYNLTVSDLIAFNNLTSNTLQIGQTLYIPVSYSDDEMAPPQGEYLNYTVVSGDNLYSIARRFNTTEQAIRNLNNLSSNVLQIGQVLRIPLASDSNANYTEYIVRSGDSLYSIAKRFGTTAAAIRAANGLTSNLLQIGQILNIPTA